MKKHDVLLDSPPVLIDERFQAQLYQMVNFGMLSHPFGQLVTKETAASTMRGYIALYEALPLIFSVELAGGSNGSRQYSLFDTNDAQFGSESGVANVEIEIAECFEATKMMSMRSDRNLLRGELIRIFGWELKPAYGPETVRYLKCLRYALANRDPVIRLAARVAFDLHQKPMVDALTFALAEVRQIPLAAIPSLSLGFTSIISPVATVPSECLKNFVEAVEFYYRVSVAWCTDIASIFPY